MNKTLRNLLLSLLIFTGIAHADPDFSLPTNSTTAATLAGQIRDNISATLTGDHSSSSNIPNGAFRLNPTTGTLQQYDSGAATWRRHRTITSTGAANTYTLTISGSVTAFEAGQTFSFISHQANTGAVTSFTINALAAKNLKGPLGNDLRAGMIRNGGLYHVEYDGTNFRVLNPSPSEETWSPSIAGTDVSNVTVTTAKFNYHAVSKDVVFWLDFTADIGAACSAITLNLPVTVASDHPCIAHVVGQFGTGSIPLSGYMRSTSTTAGDIRPHDAALLGNATSRVFRMIGTCKAA